MKLVKHQPPCAVVRSSQNAADDLGPAGVRPDKEIAGPIVVVGPAHHGLLDQLQLVLLLGVVVELVLLRVGQVFRPDSIEAVRRLGEEAEGKDEARHAVHSKARRPRSRNWPAAWPGTCPRSSAPADTDRRIPGTAA